METKDGKTVDDTALNNLENLGIWEFGNLRMLLTHEK